MMNRCVPDFEMDDDYSIPTLARPKKSNMGEDEIMELLWQNGQVVMQSQRSAKKPSPSGFPDAELIPTDRRELNDHTGQQQQPQSLFMQEDEMASWLLNETPYDFCSDLLYSSASPCVNAAPPATTATAMPTATAAATATATAIRELSDCRQLAPAPRPPIPPPRKLENFGFGHITRLGRQRADDLGPSHSHRAANDTTVVDSSDTPAAPPHPRSSDAFHNRELSRGTMSGGALAAVASSSGRGGGARTWETETAACEVTVTSSPDGSSASAEPPSQKPPPFPPPEDRKRKAREADDADCQSEDVDLDSVDPKKQARSSTSTKRSRAAEVHNQSERRRRDRINEKMKALQELIPHCNKADKASMLDEAIDYLKSLQLQVQMMSMGCSMVPMMFPGVPHYMPHLGMGMGIGMGMGMEMGMNRPMMPFPNVLAGSPLSAPGATAHLAPRFPMPTFAMQHMNPSRGGVQPGHQPDPMLNTLMMQNPNQPRIPNFIDPYQQYLGLHHLQQTQQNQNQAAQQGTSKPSTSKGTENLESPKSG